MTMANWGDLCERLLSERLDKRLQEVCAISERNQKQVERCKRKVGVYKSIILSCDTTSVSDSIRYYFDVARKGKLDIVEDCEYRLGGANSRVEEGFEFQKGKVREGVKKREEVIEKGFVTYGLGKVNRLEIESRNSKIQLEIMKKKIDERKEKNTTRNTVITKSNTIGASALSIPVKKVDMKKNETGNIKRVLEVKKIDQNESIKQNKNIQKVRTLDENVKKPIKENESEKKTKISSPSLKISTPSQKISSPPQKISTPSQKISSPTKKTPNNTKISSPYLNKSQDEMEQVLSPKKQPLERETEALKKPSHNKEYDGRDEKSKTETKEATKGGTGNCEMHDTTHRVIHDDMICTYQGIMPINTTVNSNKISLMDMPVCLSCEVDSVCDVGIIEYVDAIHPYVIDSVGGGHDERIETNGLDSGDQGDGSQKKETDELVDLNEEAKSEDLTVKHSDADGEKVIQHDDEMNGDKQDGLLDEQELILESDEEIDLNEMIPSNKSIQGDKNDPIDFQIRENVDGDADKNNQVKDEELILEDETELILDEIIDLNDNDVKTTEDSKVVDKDMNDNLSIEKHEVKPQLPQIKEELLPKDDQELILEDEQEQILEEKPIIEEEKQLILEEKPIIEDEQELLLEDEQELILENGKELILEDGKEPLLEDDQELILEEKPIIQEVKEVILGEKLPIEDDQELILEDEQELILEDEEELILEEKPMIEKEKELLPKDDQELIIDDDQELILEDDQELILDDQEQLILEEEPIIEEKKQSLIEEKPIIEDEQELILEDEEEMILENEPIAKEPAKPDIPIDDHPSDTKQEEAEEADLLIAEDEELMLLEDDEEIDPNDLI